jgi:hypothetical protein
MASIVGKTKRYICEASPLDRVRYDSGEMTKNNRQVDDVAGALLGVPTGDDSLSRDRVDDLEFSVKQRGRPEGLSRDDYIRSGPGDDTQAIMTMAGMARARSPRLRTMAVVVGSVAVATGLLLWFWMA